MPSLILTLILLLIPGLSLEWARPVHAQHKTPLDELLLADSLKQRLVYRKGQPVWLLLSQHPVEQVLLKYLSLSRSPGWQLTFPAEAEALAWLNGLNKSAESKVFMLNLYHSKTKINYVLTVGEVLDTRAFSARSIITISSMQRPFGR
ncbi:MAG: hypothetical protein CVV27_01535 [Candidatus Melainabacteria bacterium HGW-Melainabacteria-1]|nr:MAG: hypothetical protein CVV27_01535 [Candidatus Melainabacteria bacterium HGW-Melainabacteria-1]